MISKKCQYALRAIFELSKYYGGEPIQISQIAKKQSIPQRFLEVILSELRHGGFVESRRGVEGGYYLIKDPKNLSFGDIIRFFQGTISPTECLLKDKKQECPLSTNCVFAPIWEKIKSATEKIYDNAMFFDLVELEKEKNKEFISNYDI